VQKKQLIDKISHLFIVLVFLCLYGLFKDLFLEIHGFHCGVLFFWKLRDLTREEGTIQPLIEEVCGDQGGNV